MATLAAESRAFIATYPSESDRRQAVHTVYGGAHLFKADSTGKLGEVVLRSIRDYAPDASELTRVLGENWEPAFAEKHHARIEKDSNASRRLISPFPAKASRCWCWNGSKRPGKSGLIRLDQRIKLTA